MKTAMLISMLLPLCVAGMVNFRDYSAMQYAPAGGWQRDRHLVRRQSSLSSRECHLNYTTDIWTTCSKILHEFNTSYAYFEASNPSVAPNCAGYKAGNTYCMVRASADGNIPPSKDGTCGAQQNFTSTCLNSGFGDCCGSGGYCGSTSDYCGKGNCQEGNCDGGMVYSTDGQCGVNHDNLPCPPKFGLCCSQYGNSSCGNGTDYCGSGCQSGPCLASTLASTSTAPAATVSPGSVSQDGTCGYNNKQICTGSKFGGCCSAAGYCGYDSYHCAYLQGCQTAYGTCNGTMPNGSVSGSSSTTSLSSRSSSSSSSSTSGKATTSAKVTTSSTSIRTSTTTTKKA